MRFRRGSGRNEEDSRLQPILGALPRSVHQLVRAAIVRDAVDAVTVAPLTATPFVPPRVYGALPTVRNAYVRDLSRPLFASSSEASTNSNVRLQALLEALAIAGHRPRASTAIDALQPLAAVGGWRAYAETLAPASPAVTVKVFSLTGAGLVADGEMAPLHWRSHLEGAVDYTGAQVEMRTRTSIVTLRLGERPGSTAAIVKALNVSERRRGSAIDLYRTASQLADIRYCLTGEVAHVLRGAALAHRPPLDHLDVTVCEIDAGIAANRIGDDASVRIHWLRKEAFAELQSLSTSHRTQHGLIVVGPVTEQLVSHTLAVHAPNLFA